ncbi:MAG TPA: 2-phospho-L-lactate guanylyltransferase [Acidobacteriota bacterium]|nr:2-phospho-L-lactate guanylyltransferase [Acidobacteriota bacterium]
MTVVLLPVKGLDCCKQRLAPVLSAVQRRELMWTLYRRTADVLQRALKHPEGAVVEVAVVTPDVQIASHASSLGWTVLQEEGTLCESRSVDWACGKLLASGAASVLRLPCDLPLLRPEDISALCKAEGEADCLLVPSRSGNGTNALLRTPPDAFPSRFGPDSRKLHQAEARRRGIDLRILELPSVALDLDTRDDLRYFLGAARPPHRVLDLLSCWELKP